MGTRIAQPVVELALEDLDRLEVQIIDHPLLERQKQRRLVAKRACLEARLYQDRANAPAVLDALACALIHHCPEAGEDLALEKLRRIERDAAFGPELGPPQHDFYQGASCQVTHNQPLEANRQQLAARRSIYIGWRL